METYECIKTRRSIRSFLPKPVEREKLAKIIDALRWAPSSGNIQEEKVIIVRDKETKEKLAEAAYDQFFITQAPIVLVVCGETRRVTDRYGERGEFYSIQNVAAAIQNMLLMVNDLGLGACWIGAFDEDKVKSILDIPGDVKVHALIPIGYPAEHPRAPFRYDLDQFVFFDKWGKKHE